MYSKWRGLCGILSLAGSVTLLGCGSNGNTNVRAVNASQGLNGLAIQASNIQIVGGLNFGMEGIDPKDTYMLDSSGAYYPVEAGANQSILSYQTAGTPLATTTGTLSKNSFYTIVSLSPAPGHLLILADGSSAPSSGDYEVRVMDAAPTAGIVDVYITATGAPAGGSPVAGNLAFGQTVNYQPLSPGTLEIQVTPHNVPSTVLVKEPFTPASGKIYTVFLLDPTAQGLSTYGILTVSDPVLP